MNTQGRKEGPWINVRGDGTKLGSNTLSSNFACFISDFPKQVTEIQSFKFRLCRLDLRLYLPFHLLVISKSTVCCEGSTGKKKKGGMGGKESRGFYCILVHPALMRPPSLSAHLSPAGLAARGPHVSGEVCLRVCVCTCISVCLRSGDVLGCNWFSEGKSDCTPSEKVTKAEPLPVGFFCVLFCCFLISVLKHWTVLSDTC